MLHQLLNVDTTITHIKSIFSSGAKLSESLFKTVSEQFNNANIIEFLEHLRQVLLHITLIRHHQLTLLVKYFLMFQLNLKRKIIRK